jgi:hypothetical protein
LIFQTEKYKKCYSNLSMFFKTHMGYRKADRSLCADDGAERETEHISYYY